MIDLPVYSPFDKSAVFQLSILSVFFDLICNNVSSGPRKSCGGWIGGAIICFGGLANARRFFLILDNPVKRVPKVRHGFVFGRHREDLFDLAVQNVSQGE